MLHFGGLCVNISVLQFLEAKNLNGNNQKGIKTVFQFLKFICVGMINSVVNYVAYLIVLALGGHYILANLVGFVLSVLSSYLINSRLVFEKDEGISGFRVLMKLYVAYAVNGILLTNLFSWLLLDVAKFERILGGLAQLTAQLGLSFTARDLAEIIVPVIVACVLTPLNFVVNKFWAYRAYGKKKVQPSDKTEEE